MNLSKNFYEGRKLENLVENQTSYTLNNASLHIFETHEQAERILLKFDKPVLASMLKGKKIMHLRDQQSFNFLPGESLILPSDEMMCIDFPEAHFNNPTQCLAMAISEEKISNVLDHMNELMPKVDDGEWSLMDYNFHFTNDVGIYQILQRLLFLFTEDHPSKDLFVDNMLEELIIRILQTNSRKIYTEKSFKLSSDNRLAYIVEYIRKNLHNPLSVKNLSRKACMSESNFYRVFKNELGISPTDFINNERITLAVSLLQN
ncbi:MAG TPA: AraC family transcriptional regulator, partial [Christiangramia sp.]|nr:AraC family transcriptional regulator [Christiangramia sp.]